jgi:hypothetical protein
MTAYFLGTAFTLWMAVECVRRGQACQWLWVILLFPAAGAAVYFVAEVLQPQTLLSRGPRPAPRREIARLQSEVKRLDNGEAWTDYAHALRSRKRFPGPRSGGAGRRLRPSEYPSALRAGLRVGCEQFAEAARFLARVVEGPRRIREPLRAGVACESSGDKDAALRTLEALARTTSLPKVLFQLASLQAEAGDTGGARESLERIIDESEYVPSYHLREVRPWVRKARKTLSSLPAGLKSP